MKKYYGKICHEEGVVAEVEFSNKADAQLWVDGADAALMAVESDDLTACVDDKPIQEEA